MNVGERDNVCSSPVSAADDKASPLVSLLIKASDLDGDAEHRRGNRDGHLVLEYLEEPRHLLVSVVRIDGDLIDEPFERLGHSKDGTA